MRLSDSVRSYSITATITWLLLLFLVLFPKGGFKVGETPITWGYVILGVSALPILIYRLLAMPVKFTPRLIFALASTVPFQVLYIYSFLKNGIEDVGMAISIFVSFF